MNKGWFQKGDDPRRHKFTQDECREGFQKAIESIIIRHPNWVDSEGRHIACDFLARSGRHNGLAQRRYTNKKRARAPRDC